jgi:hypothetical protein
LLAQRLQRAISGSIDLGRPQASRSITASRRAIGGTIERLDSLGGLRFGCYPGGGG